MANPNDLVEDIYKLMDPSNPVKHTPEVAAEFAMNIGGTFGAALEREERPRERGKLWASDLGKKCGRQLWYKFNQPYKGEPLGGHTRFKFMYGNILEDSVLYLAREAGHEVTDFQHRVEYNVPGTGWTVSGKIDAMIDGSLCDVKSTSTYGFKKYSTEGLTQDNDTFGYLWQLGFYQAFADKTQQAIVDNPSFLWIDKQNGHLLWERSVVPERVKIEHRAQTAARTIESLAEPARAFKPKPYGKSGNMSLPVECSYCDFKQHCWRDSNDGKGLQGYAYSHGPVWFTEITRQPASTVGRIT